MIPLPKQLQDIHKLFGCLGYGQVFIISYHDLPGGQIFFQAQDKQIFILFRDAEIRNECDAQANPGQIDEKVIAAEFDFRNQIQMGFLEHGMQELAGGAFSVQHQNRVGLQFPQAYFFALKRKILLICHEHVPKLPQRPGRMGV